MGNLTANSRTVKYAYSPHRIIGMTNDIDAWRPGFPPGLDPAIDREMTGEMVCGSCLSVGMSCHPYTHPDGRYRVYAVCNFCDAVEIA